MNYDPVRIFFSATLALGLFLSIVFLGMRLPESTFDIREAAQLGDLQAKTYFVSPTGDDLATGLSSDEAFKNIQTAVNLLQNPGDKVTIQSGTYRETVRISQSGGAGNSIVIQGIGSVYIKGSDLVSDWTLADGDVWKHDWNFNSQMAFVDERLLQQIGGTIIEPSLSANFQGRVGNSLADMNNDALCFKNALEGTAMSGMAGAGCFYLDIPGGVSSDEGITGTLYVRLKDGSSPNDHVMEVTARQSGLVVDGGGGGKNVIIDNVNVSQTGGSNSNGVVLAGTNIVFKNSSVKWSSQNGLFLYGINALNRSEGIVVQNTEISFSGHIGISGVTQFATLQNSTTNYNNWRRFNCAWSCGGVKMVPWNYEMKVVGHTANYNFGPGVWFDYISKIEESPRNLSYNADSFGIVNSHIEIADGTFIGNKGEGIFVEVSDGFEVHGNRIENNQIGIHSSNSSDVHIYGNRLINNPVYMGGDPSRGAPAPLFPTIRNNRMTCNLFSTNVTLDANSPVVTYSILNNMGNPELYGNNSADYNTFSGGSVKLVYFSDPAPPVVGRYFYSVTDYAATTGNEKHGKTGTASDCSDFKPISNEPDIPNPDLTPDTTAPVISNLSVSGIMASSTTVTWTTDDPSTTQVEYGLTSVYGSFSPLLSARTTSHSLTLTGLVPNTVYHYRAISTNAEGRVGRSDDMTFTTLRYYPNTISPPSVISPPPPPAGGTNPLIAYRPRTPTISVPQNTYTFISRYLPNYLDYEVATSSVEDTGQTPTNVTVMTNAPKNFLQSILERIADGALNVYMGIQSLYRSI